MSSRWIEDLKYVGRVVIGPVGRNYLAEGTGKAQPAG